MSERDATGEEPARSGEEAWLIAPPPPPPPPPAPVGSSEPPAALTPEPVAPPPRLPTTPTPPVETPPGAEMAEPLPPAGPVDPDDTLVPLAAAGFIPPPDVPPAADSPPADTPPADTGAVLSPLGSSPGPAADPGPATTAGAPRQATHHKFPLSGGSSAAKSALREVKAISPWMLAAAAILVAFFDSWFAGIVLSFRHQPGFTGRDRVLQFFEPATLEWALAILLALVLLEVGRRFDPAPPEDPPDLPSGAKVRKSRLTVWLPIGLFLAAGAVCISAAVSALVELTNFGHGIDAAFSQLIVYVAVLGLAAAGAWWAFKDTTKAHPT